MSRSARSGVGRDTWGDLRARAVTALAAAGIDGAEGDARRLLESAAGVAPAEVELLLGDHPSRLAAAAFGRMLDRRCSGEPLQYVVGGWGFRTLDLLLDRRVLIPRPETEVVVDHALSAVDRAAARGVRPVRAVDLGTGSGAIALSLVAERPHCEVWATDVSSDALAVARANLAGAGQVATRVRLAEGRWFEALPPDLDGAVDLIVANPPYVADDDPLPAVVADWEPIGALRSGPQGLDALSEIIAGAGRWLAPDGALVLEIGAAQGPSVQRLANDAGLVDVSVHPDLSGRDRVLVAARG